MSEPQHDLLQACDYYKQHSYKHLLQALAQTDANKATATLEIAVIISKATEMLWQHAGEDTNAAM